MDEQRDVERGKKLLIPPFLTPQQEKREEKKGERKARVKSGDVEEDVVKVSPSLYEALDRPVEVEIVAPGGSSHEKKRVFRVVVEEGVPQGEIYVSAEVLKALGVAENTVVTIRKR